VNSAVEAMKLGAEDYLTKPVNPDELLILVARSLEFYRKDETIRHLQERLDERLGFEKMIGSSKAIREVFDQARMAAQSECTVLVTGESGTGKELVAEALHHNSPRRNGPFMTVNMAAVPEHLVESELFGHVKGAFTGAMAARMGRFEAAHGGSLFIDEIGDFALASQAKLLRVLENHTITPIGSNDDKQVDVRAIAATSRCLEEMVKSGKFREDLYYRLNVVTIHIPALRERPEDIPLLATHFLRIFRTAHQKEDLEIEPDLMEFLTSYSWPGNVRQLKNTLESMIVLSRGSALTVENIPATLESDPLLEMNRGLGNGNGTSLVALQRAAVERALNECKGHRARAAEALGISIRTLQRKLKAWGLEKGETVRRQQAWHAPQEAL
jgi:DNA-binding NtrC family response regulator